MAETPEYEAVWKTMGMSGLEATVAPDPGATLAIEVGTTETIRDILPILRVDHLPNQTHESHFSVRQELGRGGMGLVQLAEQRALGREVAIKTVLPDRTSRSVEDALLQEARVMGMIEHPNVVPVHIIGRDVDEKPIIVMKRIEGTPWEAFVEAATIDELASLSADRDGLQSHGMRRLLASAHPLDFHLDVLVRVAQAVAYAHSRGILHRDIKPENVMIGSFGEVYLLDWGLAVSLPGFDSPHLPRSIDANHVCGTPAYIAPEMTLADGSKIGAFTDIYLLGAVLYHCVTGRAPHRGRTLFELLRSSYEGGAFVFEESVPSELREIIARATARDPADRYPSAFDFIDAIEEFRGHRASHTLTQEAGESAAKMSEALTDGEDRIAIYRRFGEARFGFMQALKVWQDNVEAKRGLEWTLRAMIEFELADGNYQSARALVAELPAPDAALDRRIAEVERAEAERARELVELRGVAREFDASVGLREKAGLLGIVGAAFLGVAAIPMMIREMGGEIGVTYYMSASLAFFPVILGITVYGWKTFRANSANRLLLVSIWLMWLYGLMIRVYALMAGTDFGPAIAAELLVFSLGASMMTVIFYRWMIIPSLAFFGGSILTALNPMWAPELFALSGAVGCFGFAIAATLDRS